MKSLWKRVQSRAAIRTECEAVNASQQAAVAPLGFIGSRLGLKRPRRIWPRIRALRAGIDILALDIRRSASSVAVAGPVDSSIRRRISVTAACCHHGAKVSQMRQAWLAPQRQKMPRLIELSSRVCASSSSNQRCHSTPEAERSASTAHRAVFVGVSRPDSYAHLLDSATSRRPPSRPPNRAAAA